MRLERILRRIVTEAGADAVRVAGPDGDVLAVVAARPGADDALAEVAGTVTPPKAGDTVLERPTAVHVLRGLAGPVLHACLPPGADVGTARRVLADPALHAALRAATTGIRAAARPDAAATAAVGSGAPAAVLTLVRPVPPPPVALIGAGPPAPFPLRTPAAVPPSDAGAQPALSRIGSAAPRLSFALLAVRALGAEEAARLDRTTWARDLSTMRRVLDGLRRIR